MESDFISVYTYYSQDLQNVLLIPSTFLANDSTKNMGLIRRYLSLPENTKFTFNLYEPTVPGYIEYPRFGNFIYLAKYSIKSFASRDCIFGEHIVVLSKYGRFSSEDEVFELLAQICIVPDNLKYDVLQSMCFIRKVVSLDRDHSKLPNDAILDKKVLTDSLLDYRLINSSSREKCKDYNVIRHAFKPIFGARGVQ